ncbi:MAG TPA: GNAT family N-acetyltransferase [Terriglobia bacterium]|nr:GNAT family N-acetyltransferase [Terriglobia bacterium]
MQAESICEHLHWDSKFFGRRIARVKGNLLTDTDMVNIRIWCEENRIECLYFLAASADAKTSRLAESNNFRLVDVRVTLDCPVPAKHAPGDARSSVRGALQRDIPTLQRIARVSHRDSRFYYDGNFPNSLCDSLFEVWIERSCRGWAENVLVAEDEGEPAGYISCHLPAPATGKIGLFGVSEKARGKGLGKDLVSEALRWFANQGVESVKVVTQGRNVRAQRLYERCGFVTRSVELWFHRWFLGKPGKA